MTSKSLLVSVVLLALTSVVLAGTAASTATVSANGLSFQANVNVSVSTSNEVYNYRKTSLYVSSIGDFGFYSSVGLAARADTGKIDAILGAYSAPILGGGVPPAAFLAYFTDSSTANTGANSASFSGSLAAAAVAQVFDSIQEIAADGTVVNTIELSSLSFSASASLTSTSNPEILYVTFSAKSTATLGATTSVALTFAVSSVAGILNIGNMPLTPKNTEIVLEISQSAYITTGNHLRLTL